MKDYRKLTAVFLCLLLAVILGANLALHDQQSRESRIYRVEIRRASEEIAQNGLRSLDLGNYPSLISVTEGQGPEFLAGGSREYAIRQIGDRLYRFEYEDSHENQAGPFWILNLSLGFGTLLILMMLLYLGKRILGPFETLKDLPEQLAKGNLTQPVLQQKSRYFGSFLWGMDLLREKLEQERRQELELQKEKKALVLLTA